MMKRLLAAIAVLFGAADDARSADLVVGTRAPDFALQGSDGKTWTLAEFAGFVASALVIWLGARRGWPETVNTGIVFFVIFLYTKFYQWWWEIMPKYLFFLVVGLTAVLILLILKRLRQTFHAPAAEGRP